jgi:hypothetical protein
MDDEIITRTFISPDCPKNLFEGKVFFFNSCDADPLVTTFQLEKIVRHLGASTAMGPSKTVDYIVTQHLSFAKEEKVRAAVNRGAAKGLRGQKFVHPHFILECARTGRIVPTAPFETRITPPPLSTTTTTNGSGESIAAHHQHQQHQSKTVVIEIG